MADRRQRIHELVLALLARQDDLELLGEDGGALGPNPTERPSHPGQAMKRSQRIIRQYQALVHSAITLDALMDQELAGSPLASSMGASPGPSEAA
jgi:tagatose-1,6-bisphosphate aldolase non-catalytic subunit AgaZ/GatZ